MLIKNVPEQRTDAYCSKSFGYTAVSKQVHRSLTSKSRQVSRAKTGAPKSATTPSPVVSKLKNFLRFASLSGRSSTFNVIYLHWFNTLNMKGSMHVQGKVLVHLGVTVVYKITRSSLFYALKHFIFFFAYSSLPTYCIFLTGQWE